MSKNSNTTTKFTRLKCMIKRWHSSSRILTGSNSSSIPNTRNPEASRSSSFSGADEVPQGYRPIYVGKSRRRYLVTADLVDHPLLRSLLERSGTAAGEDIVVIGCEVVLFEHLLWMLENADLKPDSLDELVEFYAC